MEYQVIHFEAMNDATDRYIFSGVEALNAFVVERYIAESVRVIWTRAILLPLLLTDLLVVGGYLRRRQPSLREFPRRFRLTAASTGDWKWIGFGFVPTIMLSFAFEWRQPYTRKMAPMQPIVPELFVDPYATTANRGGTQAR